VSLSSAYFFCADGWAAAHGVMALLFITNIIIIVVVVN